MPKDCATTSSSRIIRKALPNLVLMTLMSTSQTPSSTSSVMARYTEGLRRTESPQRRWGRRAPAEPCVNTSQRRTDDVRVIPNTMVTSAR